MRRNRELYIKNIQMVALCAICSFWLLVSPIVQFEFRVETVAGMATFVAADLLLTAALSALGVALNGMADQHRIITVESMRAAIRRPWKR